MTLLEHKKIWDADHPTARFVLSFVCPKCGRDLRMGVRAKTLDHAISRIGYTECIECGYRDHIYEPMSERERVRAGDEALAKRVAR